jgi:iron(III) transport system substrate-binding protein
MPFLNANENGLPKVILCCGLLVGLLGSFGCVPKPENSLVVYSAADREYAEPILKAFERNHAGTEVVSQFDVESTKTVGLVTRIESESSRPRCDVFWNNEIMHTLRLDAAGLLERVPWDIPSNWPESMRSPRSTWVGFGARARILLINRKMLPASRERPNSVIDLADEKWKGQCGVASPLFGTTATHFTILAQRLGSEKAKKFFESVRNNAVVLSGNKQVAQAVSSGQLAFGLTDTDDGLIELDSGLPVEIVFPDQEPGQMGSILIPNTVAVIKGCPHPVAAVKLANHLLTEDTEGRLAMGSSGQIPIRPGHPQPSRAQTKMVRWMDIPFDEVSKMWPQVSKELSEIFTK